MTHRPVFTAAVAFGCAFSLLTAAQTQRQPAPAHRPRLDFVQSVGCAERENGSAATWWLTHAAEATVARPGVFNPEQLEEAVCGYGSRVRLALNQGDDVAPVDVRRPDIAP